MNYPKDIKAFYMRLNDDGRTVVATDALAPGIGEIIGGSQPEERLGVLDRSMAECHIDPEHSAR
jgi:asparaginyl-tRNA synthetase